MAIELHRLTQASELARGKIDLATVPRNFVSPDHPATGGPA